MVCPICVPRPCHKSDHSPTGNKIGKPHTVPCKVTGKCGSVQVRLIPAPRGTGIVSAPIPKHLLTMAGIEDCYTSARGSTSTLGNFGMYGEREGDVREFECGERVGVAKVWVLGCFRDAMF